MLYNSYCYPVSPKLRVLSTENQKCSSSTAEILNTMFSFGVAHPALFFQKNQKMFLINGGNSIDVLFWSNEPRSFFRLLSRFQKVNKLQYGARKGALYGQKMSFSTWMPWQYSLFWALLLPSKLFEERSKKVCSLLDAAVWRIGSTYRKERSRRWRKLKAIKMHLKRKFHFCLKCILMLWWYSFAS